MMDIIVPEFDGSVSWSNHFKVPKKPGIYFFYSSEATLLYVGKTQDMQQRVRQHFGDKGHLKRFMHNVLTVKYIIVDCPMKRDIYETYAINTQRPLLNREKVWLYEPKYIENLADPLYKSDDEDYWERRIKEGYENFGGL